MEALNTKTANQPHTRRSKLSGQQTRSLANAVGELVEHGIIPWQKQIEVFGQASVYLEQAEHAATVLRSSTAAMNPVQSNENTPPWDWFLLHQDEEIRAGVLSINPYRPVPVHDHPGASGILLVLDGHVIEHHYQLDPSTEAATGLVRLIPGEQRYLDAGQASVYLPDWNNLHSLAAMGRSAIALSIQFNPVSDKGRSWFLLPDRGSDQEVFAIRTHQGMLSHRPV